MNKLCAWSARGLAGTGRRRLLGLLLALPFVASCKADVLVDVVVDKDGSGLVTTELVLDQGECRRFGTMSDILRDARETHGDLEAAFFAITAGHQAAAE